MGDLNELNEKPKSVEESLAHKKGIRLFFGEAEQNFFERAGMEITNKILQESFLLFRIDLKKTQTHSLYGEAKKKIWLPEIEVFGRINVEPGEINSQTAGGIINRKFGNLTAHVYISHLKDLELISSNENNYKFFFRTGDFVSHKGQFYKIIDDGYSNISNQFSYGGDRRFFITIKAIEVNEDVFKAR